MAIFRSRRDQDPCTNSSTSLFVMEVLRHFLRRASPQPNAYVAPVLVGELRCIVISLCFKPETTYACCILLCLVRACVGKEGGPAFVYVAVQYLSAGIMVLIYSTRHAHTSGQHCDANNPTTSCVLVLGRLATGRVEKWVDEVTENYRRHVPEEETASSTTCVSDRIYYQDSNTSKLRDCLSEPVGRQAVVKGYSGILYISLTHPSTFRHLWQDSGTTLTTPRHR